METLVIALLTLAAVVMVIRLSFLPWWGVGMFAALGGAVVVIGQEWASGQSKTYLEEMLGSTGYMQDVALVVTVEVALHIVFAVLTGGKRLSVWARRMYPVVRWVPGLLFWGGLLAMEVYSMFSFTGVDFDVIGWVLGVACAVVVPGAVAMVKWALPQEELRLELVFVVSVTMGLLGIVGTVNGQTATQGVGEVDWLAMVGVMVLTMVMGIVGYVRYNVKTNKHN